MHHEKAANHGMISYGGGLAKGDVVDLMWI